MVASSEGQGENRHVTRDELAAEIAARAGDGRLIVAIAGIRTVLRPTRSETLPRKTRVATAAVLHARKNTPIRPMSKRSIITGTKVCVAPNPKP